ncbi:hypothetical protein KY309_02035, partial [Candidatus Woesearchaeota archaeon]|nr:hypothetical protein [Candidatus Woesearchaeota archaeon]
TPAAVTAVEDAQVTSEETAVVIKKIDDYMKSIADIPNRIDSAFTVYTDVNKKIDSAEKDIRDTTRVVEKDLKRAQKLGDTALETSAVGLNEELSRLDSDIVQEKGILGRIEDTLPLLRADSSQIRRFSTELGQFLPKLRQLNENLNTAIKSNNWQFCTQLSLEAEQLFASVAQFTGTHAGTNETLSQAIQSALDALEKSKTAIEKISGYVAEVKSKSQKLETDITAKEKGAVTEAAGVAGVIEAGNKLIPLVQQIERSNLTEKTAEEENNAFGALCLRVFNDANTLSTMIAKATVNIEKTGPAAGSTEAQIITSMKSLTGKLRQMNSTLSMIIEQSMVKERIPLLAEFKEGVSYKEGIYSDALTAFITQLKALESRLTKAVPSA